MKTGRILLAALTIVGCVAAPLSAEAQGRRGGWQGQGQRRGPIQRRVFNVREVADRAERESNSFRSQFEREYKSFTRDWDRDHGRGRRGNFGDLKRDVQRLDENMERFRGVVDDRNPRRGRDELQDALRYARNIDRFFDRGRGNGGLWGRWNDLRRDLNQLARMYDINGV